MCHRIITDDMFVSSLGSDISDLAKEGISVRTDDKKGSYMHNKFAIIDCKIVITGSYNWTSKATYSNQENVVIIENPFVVKQYMAQFENLWAKYATFNLDKLKNTAIHTTKLYDYHLKELEKQKKLLERRLKKEQRNKIKKSPAKASDSDDKSQISEIPSNIDLTDKIEIFQEIDEEDEEEKKDKNEEKKEDKNKTFKLALGSKKIRKNEISPIHSPRKIQFLNKLKFVNRKSVNIEIILDEL